MTIALWFWIKPDRTFMGIAIHNLSASGEGVTEQNDLIAALKGTAAGILGTTVQMADLVCGTFLLVADLLFIYPSAGDSFCRWRVPVHRSCCGFANVRS